jgi:predicted nuclease with TOPRIM domain
MLRHQTTSKTCLHGRGIKTETESSVLLSQDLSRQNEELKNNVSELNHKISALNEELKREKEINEILLNKIFKLGNIMNMIKPHVEEIIMESFYKE